MLEVVRCGLSLANKEGQDWKTACCKVGFTAEISAAEKAT